MFCKFSYIFSSKKKLNNFFSFDYFLVLQISLVNKICYALMIQISDQLNTIFDLIHIDVSKVGFLRVVFAFFFV
jgi:hypothetical protein